MQLLAAARGARFCNMPRGLLTSFLHCCIAICFDMRRLRHKAEQSERGDAWCQWSLTLCISPLRPLFVCNRSVRARVNGHWSHNSSTQDAILCQSLLVRPRLGREINAPLVDQMILPNEHQNKYSLCMFSK